MNNLPQYFFNVAASSTGKYHPAYALGDGGLVRHTKASARFANHLLAIEQNKNTFNIKDRSCIISAIILHDGWKHGDKGNSYTIHEHPIICAEWVRSSECLDGIISNSGRELIASAIESHMGEFTSSKRSKIVLPKPQSDIQKFVHMCDYLASRKDIEVLFADEESTKLEIPSLNEYVFTFGKHNGEKLIDVANSDPGYIAWTKENLSKEPVKSLLSQI